MALEEITKTINNERKDAMQKVLLSTEVDTDYEERFEEEDEGGLKGSEEYKDKK